MGKTLHWVKGAFSREVNILDGDQPVGKMWQESIFSYDLHAKLNDSFLLFDVRGFLKRSVNIHDLNNDNKIVGVVHFSFGKKAELILTTGEQYLWRRRNFFMKEWDLLQSGETSNPEVFHYEQLRSFFKETGEISGTFSEKHADILILTGLFIGNYFRRRRRRAAAAA